MHRRLLVTLCSAFVLIQAAMTVGCAYGTGDAGGPSGSSGATGDAAVDSPSFGSSPSNCVEPDPSPFFFAGDNFVAFGLPAMDAVRIYSAADGTYVIPYFQFSGVGSQSGALKANAWNGKQWAQSTVGQASFLITGIDFIPKFAKAAGLWSAAFFGDPNGLAFQTWVVNEKTPGSGKYGAPTGPSSVGPGAAPGDQSFTNEDGRLAVATYYTDPVNFQLDIQLSENTVPNAWATEQVSVGGKPASGWVKALAYGKDHTPWILYATFVDNSAPSSLNVLHKAGGVWTDQVLVPGASHVYTAETISTARVRAGASDLLLIAWVEQDQQYGLTRAMAASLDLTTGKLSTPVTLLNGKGGYQIMGTSIAVQPGFPRGFLALYQPGKQDEAGAVIQNGHVWLAGFAATSGGVGFRQPVLYRPEDYQLRAPQAFYSHCGTPSLLVSTVPARFFDPNYVGETPPLYLPSISIWSDFTIQYDTIQ